MRHTVLLGCALLVVLTSASAIAPRKRYVRRYSAAGLTRSLLAQSNRYLAGVRAEWKRQPVRVGGGFKRYAPFTVVSTTADVQKSDSPSAPFIGHLTIKVRYRETALHKNPREALLAPLRADREFSLEPGFAFRHGKWVASADE